MKTLQRTCGLIALFLLISPAAHADDLYFVTVYGAQRPVINQARFTHTWATFIRLSGPNHSAVETFTIGWLPASLEVRPDRLRAEPGVNLAHEDTVAWCAKNRMQISQYGPYQAQPRLWELAIRRYSDLESGAIMYRASDLINRPGQNPEVCNCIYAVLDIDGRDPAIRVVSLGFGQRGSAFVARRLSRWMIDEHQTHPWVNEMIGRENYPTVRRGLGGLLAP